MSCSECSRERLLLQDCMKPVKQGIMLKLKKKFFIKGWKEAWVVLYNDSTIAWYKSCEDIQPDGLFTLKDAPDLITTGKYIWKVPGVPTLPSASHNYDQLIAFGGRKKTYWLLATSQQDASDWMKAICSTLLPPILPMKAIKDENMATQSHDKTEDDSGKAINKDDNEQKESVERRVSDGLANGLLMGAMLAETSSGRWGEGLGWCNLNANYDHYGTTADWAHNTHHDPSLIDNGLESTICTFDLFL